MTASQIQPDALLAARERWVARGVSAPAIVAVSADGAHVQGADGVHYLDFAGGIGCQNLGHNPEAVVEAIHAQVDQYLHQCFMVAAYEPYVDVCRKLGELSPCRGSDQKSILFNSGAEAVENAVKIARAATGRSAVVAFDRGFHGRTLMTMTLTSKVKPYKKGFGPFAPEVYRAAAPYPYRGISSDDSIAALEQLFLAHVDPATVAAVILEPVQGEGGFIEMPADFPAKLRELCDRHGILWIDDEVQSGVGRTGPMWAIEHYDAQPDLLVSGKSLGGGLPLAGVTGPAEIMDAVDPGGLGGTFGGNPVSCAAANVVLEAVPGMQRRVRGAGRPDACGAGGHGDARGGDRRGPRARPDARAGDRPRPRDQDPGARGGRGRGRRGARAGPAAAGLRPARQRDPAAAAADDLRRRADTRARDPRSFAVMSHPLDPLSADEFRQAAAILRRDHGVSERWRFASIELREPEKGVERGGREAIVVCWNRDGGAAYRAVVSLTDDPPLSWEDLLGIQPNLTPDEWHECDAALRAEPRLIEALAARGITDMDRVLIDVWGYRGFLVPEQYAGRRVGWTDTWYRSEPGLQPVRQPDQRAALRRGPEHDGAAGDRGHVRRREAAGDDGRVRPALRARPDDALGPRADRDHAALRRLVHAGRPRVDVAELVAAARLQPPRRARPAPARLRRALGREPHLAGRDGRPLPRSLARPLPAHRLRHRRVGPRAS